MCNNDCYLVRERMKHKTPARPWEETPEQFKARIQEVCREINAENDVEGLCRELPERLQDLKRRKGDRLRK